MNFFWSIFPIVFLLFAMGRKNGLQGAVALPIAAALALGAAVLIFGFSAPQAIAAVLEGSLSALTPISIVFGAMLLFSVMSHSGATEVVRQWLQGLSQHPVAQLMLIGWTFPFLIEGISGFGTPAALAAPLLVALGFSPLQACFMTLIANTVPVTFGAVGTPIWFGLGNLGLTNQETLALAARVGTIQLVCGLVIPFVAVAQVVPLELVKKSSLFILLSALSCALPMWVASFWTPEFPSLVGGACGFVATAILARFGVGLKETEWSASAATPDAQPLTSKPQQSRRGLMLASSPIWGSILVLVLTRLPFLGIKDLLLNPMPAFGFAIPWVGTLTISNSLLVGLQISLNGTETLAQWHFATLYVPAIIPFVVVSVLFAFAWQLAGERQKAFLPDGRALLRSCVGETLGRVAKPAVALVGALVLVKVIMLDSAVQVSAVTRMGVTLSSWSGDLWPWFSFYLGALGSFFAGSATVSNLTFGAIQQSVGAALRQESQVLALQAVGAAAGNMVCLHNIIAVAAILGLAGSESALLKRNALVLVGYGTLATLTAIVLR